MSWRPERPPASAVRVINASRELDAADKTVWREIHQLDRGPEGCYAKPAHFARRIGRSVDAMKKSRKRLADLGLVHRAPRRGPCPDSWFATLPRECWPPNNAKDEAVFPLADMLDGLIRRGGTYGDDAGDSDAVARGRAAVSQAVCATGIGGVDAATKADKAVASTHPPKTDSRGFNASSNPRKEGASKLDSGGVDAPLVDACTSDSGCVNAPPYKRTEENRNRTELSTGKERSRSRDRKERTEPQPAVERGSECPYDVATPEWWAWAKRKLRA
jgi:hypothetical protein